MIDLSIRPTQGINMYCGNQLFDAVKAEAQSYFEAANEQKRAINSIDEARRYQQEKKRLFLELLGGLPVERTDLQAVTTGVTQREGYRIEKVIFQSRPDFHVTGLLYVPDILREEKNPAVLFVCGHWGLSKGIFQYQFVCQELVKAGFVVLAIDPIGQGERQQYFVPDGGYGRYSFGVPEHTRMGLQCMLAGSSLAAYYIWDMMRAVDYLSALPYVDPQRIGCTGNSGGGTQTSYLMITDERIAAAAPCTYINDRQLFLESGQPHDAEQNVFGSISKGIGHDDFMIAFAPKPVMVGAARFDFFHLKGTEKSMESARRIYRLFGKEELCSLAVADTEHCYSPALRKAAANFFLQHLSGLPPAHQGFTDDQLTDEPRGVTNCTTSGNVIAEFANERKLFSLNKDFLRFNRSENRALTPETLANVLGIADKLPLRASSTYRIEVLKSPIDAELYEYNGVIRKRVEYFTEDGIFLTGIYFQERRTEGTRVPLWILVPENGLADGGIIQNRVLDLIWNGNAAFVCDVRGVGVSQQQPVNATPLTHAFNTEFIVAYDYFMMGRSLPGLRAFDVLRALDCLTEMGGDINTDDIAIHGYGAGALYALFAAALEPRIKKGIFEGMLSSYEAIVNTEYYLAPCPERQAVHGILRHFDIPDILKSLQPRKFEIVNPLSVGGDILSGGR